MRRPRLLAPEALYLGSLLPPLVAAATLVWVRSWTLLVVLAVGAAALRKYRRCSMARRARVAP